MSCFKLRVVVLRDAKSCTRRLRPSAASLGHQCPRADAVRRIPDWVIRT